jgi:hypothetical protein
LTHLHKFGGVKPSSETSVSRPVLVAALLATALAAWLSQGTLAVTSARDSRIALLPLSIPSASIVVLVTAGVWLAWRLGASLAPLWLLGLLVLPWLSASMPAASVIWSGPLALAVWLGIGLSLAASSPAIDRVIREQVFDRALRTRPALTAGALACVIYAIAAWQASPSVLEGDEPHYLIITQSLLKDHDLRIENNHRNGDYRAYYRGELLKPDFRRYGRDGEIYSIHAPGLPAIVAPAFAIAGYHGVVVFLILIASAGSALSWLLAWRVTRQAEAAWFGWAAVTLAVSGIFHSFMVYPDGLGGVIALTGVWALLRTEQESESGSERTGPWWLHGAALATLPWIHTRFALIAGSLGALIILRLSTTRNAAGKAVAFLTIPAISAVCWVGFFIAIYGTPDPLAPYANEEGSSSFIPGGLTGLFFDQRFGLLAYSPVLVVAFAGLVAMLAERRWRRLGLELLFVLVPYLMAVTHFAMWWGGHSAPARFFVPMLPLLAIPAGVGWTRIQHRATRATVVAALTLTAFTAASLVFVDDGRLAFNVRETYAVWLGWLNSATDLARGMPAWWRDRERLLYRDVVIWVVSFAAWWAVLRAVERKSWLRGRGALAAAAGAAYAAAAMVALTIVWALAGVDGRNIAPAQLEILRHLGSERHPLTFALPAFHPLDVAEVPRLLRMELRPSNTPGGAGPNDRPLYQVAAVPAGRYRLHLRGSGTSGWLMIGIGRDQFSLKSGPLSSPPQPIDLDFPVDVRAIVVRGDEQARRSVRALTIEPLSVVPAGGRLASDYARRAVRYGTANVFFLDERAFPEPEAFWIGGARSSTIVIQPDGQRSTATLLIRNAPVDNHVRFESAKWRDEMSLGPGEERRVQVPIDLQRGAALLTVTTSAGFRPSAVDPKSRDDRFLGVFIRVASE